MSADASDVRKEMTKLVKRAREDLAEETARTLRYRGTTLWPIRTGVSASAFQVREVDDRGFLIDNQVHYAIFVEAKHTRPKLPARTTVRQNLTAIVRKISGRLTN